jgi:hypothetical protein
MGEASGVAETLYAGVKLGVNIAKYGNADTCSGMEQHRHFESRMTLPG